MGHIELAAPVVHIWSLRGTRSWLAYLLMGTEVREELKAKQLEKVIYFAANLVTWVDEEKRHEDLPNLEVELQEEIIAIKRGFDEFKDLHGRKIIDDELLWRELKDRYGDYFEGGMGAEALARLIDRIDFDVEEVNLRGAIDPQDG